MGNGHSGEKPYDKIEVPVKTGEPVVPPGPISWGPLRKTGSQILFPMVRADNPRIPLAHAVPGIDISHYQPNLKWGAIVGEGFKFAIIKATDGTGSKSSTFDAQRLAAHNNGIIAGAYHFARFGGLSAKDEAAHFLKVTGGVRGGELPLTIDCEWDRYTAKYSSGHTMDEAAAKEILEILERVEAAIKMTPILYTSYPFFKGFSNPERFFRFHPWNPAYWRAGTNQITGPKSPLPWSKPAFWQWTDKYPNARKITGDDNLDANWFNGSITELGKMTKQ